MGSYELAVDWAVEPANLNRAPRTARTLQLPPRGRFMTGRWAEAHHIPTLLPSRLTATQAAPECVFEKPTRSRTNKRFFGGEWYNGSEATSA